MDSVVDAAFQINDVQSWKRLSGFGSLTVSTWRGVPATQKGTRMSAIKVTHLGNYRLGVAVGRHCFMVDQPRTAGGDDLGPTAVQLFAASLVACTAHYAGSFLARHNLPAEDLMVEGDFVMADDKPPRLISMTVTVTPPPGLSANRRMGLLAVASHCTVHNTILQPPTVTSRLCDEQVPALTGAGNGNP
jgi:uncharacterized OsmC-like protein